MITNQKKDESNIVVASIGTEDIEGICGAYCGAFKGAPWYEDWTLGAAFEVLQDAQKKEDFVGLYAKREDEVVGFIWGYRMPEKRTPTVDFPQVQSMLGDKDIRTEDMFYYAEVGIKPDKQLKGLGTMLQDAWAAKLRKKGYKAAAARTINPVALKVMAKSFTQPEYVFDDPENKTPWYVMEVKR